MSPTSADDIDAKLRKAVRRGQITPVASDDGDTEAPTTRKAATPAPLPSGGAFPDYTAGDPDQWLKDEVHRRRYGTPPRRWW